eukprot:3855968-Prymnesium_polylepis.1
MDEWLWEKRPLGEDITSFSAWEASLQERGAQPPSANKLLEAFMGETIKAPPIRKVKEAIVAFETDQANKLARVAEAVRAADARKQEVVRALAQRGHELDESLQVVCEYASAFSHGGAWKLGGEADDALLGEHKARVMADKIIQRGARELASRRQQEARILEQQERRVAAAARRKALQAALRRRKLTRVADPS